MGIEQGSGGVCDQLLGSVGYEFPHGGISFLSRQ